MSFHLPKPLRSSSKELPKVFRRASKVGTFEGHLQDGQACTLIYLELESSRGYHSGLQAGGLCGSVQAASHGAQLSADHGADRC
jgi:hypothetical protein